MGQNFAFSMLINTTARKRTPPPVVTKSNKCVFLQNFCRSTRFKHTQCDFTFTFWATIVITYALSVCKIFGSKNWLCKIFNKSHVCGRQCRILASGVIFSRNIIYSIAYWHNNFRFTQEFVFFLLQKLLKFYKLAHFP